MPAPAQRAQPFSPALHLHLDCTFAAVRQGASEIRAFLHNRGLHEKDIWACELAFVEGCNNAVEHTPAAHTASKIMVELSLAPGHIELRIKDHSEGCEFPADPSLPPADSERGRGIFLIRSLMDDVVYLRSSSSNCLVLKKAVTGI
jgi:anti-sigma regulatory factor (Ser/Thr protein kinase)